MKNNLIKKSRNTTKSFIDLTQTKRKRSKAEISGHKCADERLTKLNECFLSFNANSDENINLLVALCGEQLGAACALYNRLKDGMLCSVGQWNTPPDYVPVDKPEGHICFDLIQGNHNEVCVIRDLPNTIYAKTDPNVISYGLKTYVGKTVSFSGTIVGSLCVVYQEDNVLSEDDKKFLEIIASVIGVEEKRKRAEEVLQSERDRFRGMLLAISDGVDIINKDYIIEFQNELLQGRFGDRIGEKCYVAYMGLKGPCDFCRIQEAIRTNNATRVELVGPDGRAYELNSSPFTDVDGTVKVIELVRDITERKQVEEEYRTITRTAMDGFWIVDMQGRFLDVNDAYCRLIGYSRDELLTMRISDIEAVERPEETARRIQKIMEVGGDRFETRHKCKDDRIIDIEVSVNYMKVGGGRMFVFIRDITERKRVEEVLRRSEEESKQLSQENAIMAEIGRIISSTLNIDEVYERFAEEVRKVIPFDRISITLHNFEENTIIIAYVTGIDVPGRRVGDVISMDGTPNEEIARTRSSLLIQTEDRAELAARFPTLLPNFQVGFHSMMLIPMISKNQVIGVLHLRSLKSNAYTEKDLRLAERVSNQIAGAIANAQLFAEGKQAEEALYVSEKRFKELFDQAPVGYHELDTEGRITQVNRTELEMFGYTADEMLGQHFWKFSMEKERSQQLIMAKIRGEVPPGRQFERTYRRKDGTIFPILVGDRLLRDSEGRIIGIRSTIQDITERKRAEEERENLIHELQDALGKIKTLRGLIPICASCKKIRDDKGYWNQIETYIQDHSEADFSHGICPACAKKLYPDLDLYEEDIKDREGNAGPMKR